MELTCEQFGRRDTRDVIAGSEREPLLGTQAPSRPGPSNVSHMIEVEGRVNRTK